MVKLKEIPRTAAFAWSPSVADPLLATGTVAGAIDADFSATTQLELWDLSLLDRSSDGFQLSAKKSIDTDARFYDIAWGAVSESHPQGLIAGALESGSLELWDPQSILTGNSAPVQKSTKHTGAIKSIQFNPIQSKVLASGGSKGEIFVWDLTKMDSPYSPGTQSSRHDEIESVSWNNSVSHILATGGNTGFTSIWDLRNRREVLHLHYSSQAGGRHAVSSVQWHPNNSTKLMTASEDDNSPVILLWDLRNANAPERVLHGHNGGVLSLDWCNQDSALLLSSGKDNRTLLWNPETGENLGEYPIATNWAFETRFNPQIPDIIASASFDGKITVQSLQDADTNEQKKGDLKANEDFWNPSSYVDTLHPTFKTQQPPKWLKRPASATFGFGGKIVSVKTVDGKSSVSLSKFVGDESLSEETTKFSTALDSENVSSIIEYRKEFASDDKYDWDILTVLSNFEGDFKTSLAKFIGIDNAKEPEVAGRNGDTNGKTEEKKADGELFDKSDGDDDEFLRKLSIKDEEAYVPEGQFSLFGDAQSETDKYISQAILKGEISKAVDFALKENLLSDAFMLSLNGDAAIRKRVQDVYAKKYAKEKPYIRILSSVGNGNLDDLTDNGDVSEWKDIFSALFTYAKDRATFSKLSTKLGDRIVSKKSAESLDSKIRDTALLCYAVGSSLSKTSAIWLSEINATEKLLVKESGATPYAAHVKALHRFIEKVTVFREAVGSSLDTSGDLEPLYDAYRDYASIVAAQGDLKLAEKFLNLLPSEHPGVSLEKERVAKASTKKAAVPNYSSAGAAAANRFGLPVNSAASSPSKIGASQRRAYSNAPVAASSAPSAVNQGSNSIYAPVQQPSVPNAEPAGIPPGPKAPLNAYTPAAAISNPYAPVANPYQPVASQPKPVSPAPIAPPPTVSGKSGVTPPPPPTSQSVKAKNPSGWNDLPTNALAATSASLRRPLSSAQTVVSPFPNQSTATSPVSSPGLNGPPRGSGFVPPPPITGPPPKGALASPAPVAPPPSNGAVVPPVNPYAAIAPVGVQPTAGGQNFPPPAGQPFAPPPPQAAERVLSPVNPYAPPPGLTGGIPTPGQAASIAYASPPAAAAPRTPQVPHPPPSNIAASSIASPPPPPRVPTPPPVVPKYPPGDRSHIPEASLPIYEILSQEIERVKPNIPPNFKRQVVDCEKRLNILFDHLNNDDLLSADTVEDLATLSRAIYSKDYDTANQLHLDILTSRVEQCGQWMVGVKRLIEMSRAVV